MRNSMIFIFKFLIVVFFLMKCNTTIRAQQNVQIQIATPCAITDVKTYKKQENAGYSVFPNPCNGYFIVGMHGVKTNKTVELKIYNSMGLIVLLKKIKPAEINYNETISIPELSDGIYFVRIYDGENVYSKKLIVNK